MSLSERSRLCEIRIEQFPTSSSPIRPRPLCVLQTPTCS
jgi:hypothetical protein